MLHQYVERTSREILDERLFGDRVVRFLYSRTRENAPALFRLLTGARASEWLSRLNFDLPLAPALVGSRRFLASCGVDLAECLPPPGGFRTPRQIFERQIRYWEHRPMSPEPGAVISPADARVLVGSLETSSLLWLKGKFFELEELLGHDHPQWHATFRDGDCAIFRLTPEQYHYNHVPVSGRVLEVYELAGVYHSCNPSAVVELATPYSKNRRMLTVIETDVAGGSWVGKVAMIEVVALMIGSIVQCYSAHRYDDPRPLAPGMLLERGAPKSLYRPGSSTDVLLFEKNRVRFADDLLANQHRDAASRFSLGFGAPLVETEVQVRSTFGHRNERSTP